MNYRLQLQGMLAERRIELKGLAIRAMTLRENIHVQCNPHLPIEDIPMDKIEAQAEDLKRLVRRIRKVKEEMRTIQADLGEVNE